MARGSELTARLLWLPVLALVMTTSAACNGDGNSDSSAPPVPSATAESTTESADPATTPESTTTGPESTTTELNPVPTTPAPPPSTTTAPIELPPVSTLVPQVPAELLTPEQLDPFNVNNSRPILPEHVPVIEAYLRAANAYGLVASRAPLDPDAPELLAAPYTPEVLIEEQADLRARAQRGEILDVSQGSNNRPYVIGPVTEIAVLFDCYLDGTYWLAADGSPIPPTEIFRATPGSIIEGGVRINMVQRDGQWLFNSGQIDDGACA